MGSNDRGSFSNPQDPAHVPNARPPLNRMFLDPISNTQPLHQSPFTSHVIRSSEQDHPPLFHVHGIEFPLHSETRKVCLATSKRVAVALSRLIGLTFERHLPDGFTLMVVIPRCQVPQSSCFRIRQTPTLTRSSLRSAQIMHPMASMSITRRVLGHISGPAKILCYRLWAYWSISDWPRLLVTLSV